MNVKHLASILLVEGDEANGHHLFQLLKEHFINVRLVSNYEEATEALHKEAYDVVISSYHLNGQMNGIDLRKWLLDNSPQLDFVLITGLYGNDIVKHLEIDHFTVLQKPVDPHDLVQPLKLLFDISHKKAA